ncbi:MAG: hypothetical protein KDA89_23675, partial [Planctomycetaceae bacterium]|nr:hypothetical protein [Planctomycetaceae bacterium]
MFSSATTNRGLPQMRVIIHVVGAGTSLAIALIGYALYFASTGTAEQSRRAGMAADRAILDQRDAIVLRQKQLRGDRESMQQRLRELTAMIPDAPEESRFLAQVSELAQKTQLEIDNFR